MKSTVTLSPENTTALAWAVELTGLPIDEVVNILLAGLLEEFQPDNDDGYPHEEIGCWKFRDRRSAERTLKWVEARACKGGNFLLIQSAIRELADGRFEIDAFRTERNGECTRVC